MIEHFLELLLLFLEVENAFQSFARMSIIEL